MDISKFDDSTILDVEIYYYENTDEIDLHVADPRYRNIEWDDRLLSKVTEKAIERLRQRSKESVDEIIREWNAEKE